MFVFDTDHLSLLQHGTSPEFESIARRCSSQLASEFFVTIVSFHEQINGWTKYVAKSKNSGSLVHGYSDSIDWDMLATEMRKLRVDERSVATFHVLPGDAPSDFRDSIQAEPLPIANAIIPMAVTR